MTGAGTPTNPFWIVVGGVALLTLVVGMIQRGNRRQRPILWLALVIAVVMVLYPPWVGEKGSWVDVSQEPGQYDPQYVCSSVSMGYAPLFLPPRRTWANTNEPIRINGSRMLIQIGVVALIGGGCAVAFRSRRIPRKGVDETSAGPAEDCEPEDENRGRQRLRSSG